ncbi:glycosyltransferase [Fodinibius sp. SL11]|uniref:glycosyltransferase n=1 Tax=Fodinibius sp. SL11 TaxID=3425690 RepID=UPI003F8814FD
MKLLQINVTANSGSTGRIAESIGNIFLRNEHESYIAFGQNAQDSQSELIKIGSKLDNYIHGLKTRFFDRHGFASKKATKYLIGEINKIQPDAIGLHNLHGYYLHLEVLFNYLKNNQHIPVVWTLHDCWPFTGHCIHFSDEGCEKWKTHCENCPLTHTYPKSFFDNSHKNFEDKRRIFTGHSNLIIVTPSRWLKKLVNKSFLKNYKIKVIQNGVDLKQFRILNKREANDSNKKIVLGVASVWEERKGLNDFIKLSKELPVEYQIVLIGINKSQKKNLPQTIKAISRTEDISELVKWYNQADVFVNPSKEETFGMVTAEAMACGTPVAGYNATATSELVSNSTGKVVKPGDIDKLAEAVISITDKEDKKYKINCRDRAETLFDQEDRFTDYYNLYQKVLN